MGFSNKTDEDLIAEINIAPLVDVMLVLLIIFMIAAPYLLNKIEIALPQTQRVNKVSLNKENVILTYSSKGELALGDKVILLEELPQVLRQRLLETKTKTLYLKADHKLSYGKVASLIALLKNEGIDSIGLMTEEKEEK